MGFEKAKSKQAAVKMAMYGKQGTGKTFTSLLVCEGLSKITGKRTAYVDTENRGTDFYAIPVKSRNVHPAAFDFDALYTKSATEIIREVQKVIASGEYGQLVIDSMSQFWDACVEGANVNKTADGQIQMWEWGKIKKPYKDFINLLMSCNLHVILCGREANEFGKNNKGKDIIVGKKMKGEGETPYEPHILIQMLREENHVVAFAEKDRTGTISGKVIADPTYDTLVAPFVDLLSGEQAKIQSSDDCAAQDSIAFADQEEEKGNESKKLHAYYMGLIKECNDLEELKRIGADANSKNSDINMPEWKAIMDSYKKKGELLSFNFLGSDVTKEKKNTPPPDPKAQTEQGPAQKKASPDESSCKEKSPENPMPETASPAHTPPNDFVKPVAEHQEAIEAGQEKVDMFPEDPKAVAEQAERKALLIKITAFAKKHTAEYSILEGKHEVKDVEAESIGVLRNFGRAVENAKKIIEL